MTLTAAEIKARSFAKKLAQAPIISCACGCGVQLKAVDHYGRPKSYVNGHNGRKYEDPGQFKREWNHRNREYRRALKMKHHRLRKAKLIILFGGKCTECHTLYSGMNAAIFHFHHRDPTQKLFAVGNQIMNKSWDRIVDEANKCDMICANCHEMRHSEQF